MALLRIACHAMALHCVAGYGMAGRDKAWWGMAWQDATGRSLVLHDRAFLAFLYFALLSLFAWSRGVYPWMICGLQIWCVNGKKYSDRVAGMGFRG